LRGGAKPSEGRQLSEGRLLSESRLLSEGRQGSEEGSALLIQGSRLFIV
jgi:hypothetical protein